MSKNIHILQIGDNRWQAKRDGEQKAFFVAVSQSAVLDVARQIAKRDEVEVYLHGENDNEMFWEKEAKNAIKNAIRNMEQDNIRGVIYSTSKGDFYLHDEPKEFKDINSLYSYLSEIGETEWNNYVPYDKGPVFEADVDSYVDDAIEELGAESFFLSTQQPKNTEEIINSHELLTAEGAKVFRIDVESINEELVKYLAKHPEKLTEMSSRNFEELVAELFKDKGYEIELTPASKDGGFDIRAVRKTAVGCGLTLIECKRYSQKKKVGVDIVRGLYGVVEDRNATNGLIVTTSYFTKGSVDFQRKNAYRLELTDRDKLLQMLKGYKKQI
jgi:HJR/Mrr/RecB family endonuclease